MTFPILGANSAVGGYQIDNSLRYNNNDSPELSRTPLSAGNKKTFTFSTWLKRGELSSHSGGASSLLVAGITTNILNFRFQDSGILNCILSKSGSTANGFAVDTDAVFRDVSAYYHILLVVDTTQASITDAVKIYVNNTLQSFSSSSYGGGQNVETPINDTLIHSIGYNTVDNNQAFDGYLAETYLIDGQALSPTDFGEFDEDSGIWKPIQYTGTYGTNGFYLDFEDSGSLGADQSGNGNNFTPTNLASTDQMLDTPTNNFCTLNPLYQQGSNTFSEGNCKVVLQAGDGTKGAAGNFAPPSGKWYWEVKHVSSTNSSIMVREVSDKEDDISYFEGNYAGYEKNDGDQNVTGNTTSTYGASYGNGDIIMVAMDMDNDRVYFGKNGLWNDGDGNADESNLSDFVPLNGVDNGVPAVANANGGATATFEFNFGNPPFSISSGNSDGNGYGNFEYAPPSGYLALCTQNLATELSPTIDDGSEYFNTVLYTGTGTTQSITGVGFQPDWTWIKCRSVARDHTLTDSSRGATQTLISNTTGAESTDATGLTSFDTDGFTLGGANAFNGNTETHVAWNWLANGGTTSSNTDGDITSTVQANPTAGFSVVTYTGNGNASPQTVGHGLGKKCQTVILKTRSVSGQAWRVYQDIVSASAGGNLFLNSTDALITTDPARVTATSSSTFTLTGYTSPYNGVNQSGSTYVAYCFAEIEGYSKFGSYTANGSTDGPMITTMFRPSFVIFKRTDGGTSAWQLHDRTRETINDGSSPALKPNATDAEFSKNVDFLSNGIKIRDTSSDLNGGSGQTYIYMAFAENPFVSSTGVPVTAR